MLRKKGNAHARAEVGGAGGDRVGLVQRLAQLVGDRHRPLQRRLGQDREEFVTADPADRVGGAHAGARTLGDLGEHAVGRGVAPCVVHGLEAVEVRREKREATRVAARARHFLRQAIGEQGAVGQSGDDVEMGEALDACLRFAFAQLHAAVAAEESEQHHIQPVRGERPGHDLFHRTHAGHWQKRI